MGSYPAICTVVPACYSEHIDLLPVPINGVYDAMIRYPDAVDIVASGDLFNVMILTGMGVVFRKSNASFTRMASFPESPLRVFSASRPR